MNKTWYKNKKTLKVKLEILFVDRQKAIENVINFFIYLFLSSSYPST